MTQRDIFPRPLKYLIAVAEHGSYTHAAEALFVSQPTLSQQIKQLEESLELQLLDRSGRTVKLTDAGKIYVHHARRAWAELDLGARAIHDVRNLSRGSLRLGWTPITDLLTCSILGEYNRLYPGITLTTLEMTADEIEMAVIENRIDFGIVFSKPPSSKLRSLDIDSHTLFKESFCLSIGNTHRRAGQRERMSAKELGRESLVLLNNTFAFRQQIERYFVDQGISPNIAIEADSLSVIMQIIQTGPLATIFPKSIVHAQSGINMIMLAPSIPHQEITVIRRKHGYKSRACQAFYELMLQWIASNA